VQYASFSSVNTVECITLLGQLHSSTSTSTSVVTTSTSVVTSVISAICLFYYCKYSVMFYFTTVNTVECFT
jgi:hypothetical protein